MIKKRKPRNPEWLAWVSLIPKSILIEDLVTELLPMEKSECFAEIAWETYHKHHPNFIEVEFSQFK